MVAVCGEGESCSVEQVCGAGSFDSVRWPREQDGGEVASDWWRVVRRIATEAQRAQRVEGQKRRSGRCGLRRMQWRMAKTQEPTCSGGISCTRRPRKTTPRPRFQKAEPGAPSASLARMQMLVLAVEVVSRTQRPRRARRKREEKKNSRGSDATRQGWRRYQICLRIDCKPKTRAAHAHRLKPMLHAGCATLRICEA
jgi:hypothetical protein